MALEEEEEVAVDEVNWTGGAREDVRAEIS